jgi:hypothetical protein
MLFGQDANHDGNLSEDELLQQTEGLLDETATDKASRPGFGTPAGPIKTQ